MSVTLKVGGQLYNHWTRVSVQRSILQAAGQFNLSYSGARNSIKPGTSFSLLLDKQQAMTGYIDSVQQRLTQTEHSCTAQGRDKTADLVDCSNHYHDAIGDLAELYIDELIEQFCAPYNIKLKLGHSISKGEKLSLGYNPGETAWTAIERACRQRALLAMSDGQGHLVLTRSGAEVHKAALVEGVNVLSAEFNQDYSDRYHRYLWLLQTSDAKQWVPDKSTVQESDKAELFDSEVRAPRTLISLLDNDAGDTFIGDQVVWEYNVRRGKSHSLTVEVAGFSALGQLYEPNQLITCQLPSLAVKGQWLIVSTLQTYDERGSKTQLQLVPPSAFSLLPQAEQANDKKQWMEDKL